MITFQQILNGETGLSVRSKLNSMLQALISGNEGVNSLWDSVDSLDSEIVAAKEDEQADYEDLLRRVSDSNNHTDKEVRDLYSYISGVDGGVGGLIDSTSYDPSELPADKAIVLIALGAGTYTNLLDVTGSPIVVTAENSITVFYRAANATYWSHKTEVLAYPSNGWLYKGIATPSTDPGTPAQNMYYFAVEGGLYENFDNIRLPWGIHILKWNNSWSAESLFSGNLATIPITEIDTLSGATNLLATSPSRYTVTVPATGGDVIVGVMDVLSDNSRHVITEVLTTHYVLTSAGELDLTEHMDGELFQYYRSVKVAGGTLPTPVGTWTKWSYLGGERKKEFALN